MKAKQLTVTPRIKSLTYKVISGKNVDYRKVPKLREETDDFTFRMDAEKAIFELQTYCTTLKEARAITDDFLERWKVYIGLEHGPGDLSFEYTGVDYELIQQEGKAHRLLAAGITAKIIVSENVTIHVSRNQFPSRPHGFKISPDVITMYERFQLFRIGKESLPSMAYLCLTVLEASARNSTGYDKKNNLRGKASFQYGIEYQILQKLGELASTRGDQKEARKAPKTGSYDPLKPEERTWIENAIKRFIYRAGEYAYDPQASLNKITMADI